MRKFMIVAAALAAVAAVPVHAATLIVGTGTGSNVFPFGGADGGDKTQYQQVYDKGVFAAPISIRSVSFQRTSGGSTLATGTVTLSASTTSAAVDALSTDFAANIGSNNRTVFSGALQPNFDGNVLRFVFASPFVYRPGAGNLLLNFVFSDYESPDNLVTFLANNGDANGVYSRVHDFGQGFRGYGLVTTFETSPLAAVPEPSTWAMLILGFGLVGGAMRSSRHKSVRVRFA